MINLKDAGRQLGEQIRKNNSGVSDTEIALMAVAEIAEKTGITLEAIPESILERAKESRIAITRAKIT